MMHKHAFLLPAFLLLASCMKDELPVPAVPRGDARELQVCMGPGYQNQVWFDLASGTAVSSNPKVAWELAFESAPQGWAITLNGSRMMTAWNIGDVDIAQATDTTGMALGKHIDAPSGTKDSTALGDWRGSNNVYVIDLGFNVLGQQLGFRKLRPVSVDASGYTMEVARLNGSQHQVITVAKDPARSNTHFSFANGVVQIAPVDSEWDMVFTQYTHQFYEPFQPYIVSGVLFDGSKVRVAHINGSDLGTVTLADTMQHPFSRKRDAIGYDWKDYSFDSNSYTVTPGQVYIVQDAQGAFHKLQFTDFYSETGQVGCPRFSVVTL